MKKVHCLMALRATLDCDLSWINLRQSEGWPGLGGRTWMQHKGRSNHTVLQPRPHLRSGKGYAAQPTA